MRMGVIFKKKKDNIVCFCYFLNSCQIETRGLNEQVYTLLMVVDQNHHGDRRSSRPPRHSAKLFFFSFFFFPLSLLVLPQQQQQQQQRLLLRARMLNRRQKSEFFLSDSGLAAPWRGGLWERQGAEALMLCGRWHRSDALPPEPMALLKITAQRLAAVCVCV